MADPATRRRTAEGGQAIDVRNAQASSKQDRLAILDAIGDAVDEANALLKLLLLLEPHASVPPQGPVLVRGPVPTLPGTPEWLQQALGNWLQLPPDDPAHRYACSAPVHGTAPASALEAEAMAHVTMHGRGPTSSWLTGCAFWGCLRVPLGSSTCLVCAP